MELKPRYQLEKLKQGGGLALGMAESLNLFLGKILTTLNRPFDWRLLADTCPSNLRSAWSTRMQSVVTVNATDWSRGWFTRFSLLDGQRRRFAPPRCEMF
jgi:hypothetical protein